MDTHAVIVADTEGLISRWDSGAETLFGWSEVDAVGQSLDLVVPKHLRDAHWKGFKRAMLHPQIKDLAARPPGPLRRWTDTALRWSAPGP